MTRTLYPGKVEPVLTSSQFPETVTEDRWHEPWSEPNIKKFFLNAALQQFIAYYPTPITTIASTAVVVPVHTLGLYFKRNIVGY